MEILKFVLCLAPSFLLVAAKSGETWDVQCMRELNITPEELKVIVDKDDPKFGCLQACVFTKRRIMVGGKLTVDRILQALELRSTENIPKVVRDTELCVGLANKKIDWCDVAYTFQTCFVDQSMKSDNER